MKESYLPQHVFNKLTAEGWTGENVFVRKDQEGTPLLVWAVKKWSGLPPVTVVGYLKEILPWCDLEATDAQGQNALHIAATSSAGFIPFLLEAGVPPDTVDLEGSTPLFITSHHSGVSVRALLAAGADPNLPLKSGCALHAAVQGTDIDAVAALLGAGAFPDGPMAADNPQRITPLMVASFAEGACQAAEKLLEAGADPLASFSGRTVLMFAILSASPRTLGWLIEKGADTTTMGQGVSPLRLAAMHNPALIPVLLASGSPPQAFDNPGEDALAACLESAVHSDKNAVAAVAGINCLIHAGAERGVERLVEAMMRRPENPVFSPLKALVSSLDMERAFPVASPRAKARL